LQVAKIRPPPGKPYPGTLVEPSDPRRAYDEL